MTPEFEVTILMPCLNEAETLAFCIAEANKALSDNHLKGEVLVADNGSTDGSQEIARSLGARVVDVVQRGYGSALRAGIQAARSNFVVMGDSDGSYDFSHINRFVEALRGGADLAMGNRFLGGIQPKAMPWKNRYIGNPVLSLLGRIFFKGKIGDFHCGLRAIRKDTAERLGLNTTGMEFASEMVIKAQLAHVKIVEVPTTLRPDGRSRPPHLRPWRDGWRHLRFMLLFSPRWLFLHPGLLLMAVCSVLGLRLIFGPLSMGATTLDVHTLFFCVVGFLVGFQSVSFAVLAKQYTIDRGWVRAKPSLEKWLAQLSLESGVVIGSFFIIAGLCISLWSVAMWGERNFGPLDPRVVLRYVLPAGGLIVLGCQIVLNFLFLGVLSLGIDRKGGAPSASTANTYYMGLVAACAAAILSVLLKFWLAEAQPIIAVGPASIDDRLFLNLAANLLNGDWLGSYDQMTLAKGPMYSLWIAAVNWVGLPLPVAQHALYLASCLIVILALRPLIRSWMGRSVLFHLLWWNPMTFELPVLGRVLRQNIYTPLSLICFACAVACCLRVSVRLRFRLLWGSFGGLSLGLLWLTREESIWILPALGALGIYYVYVGWRGRRFWIDAAWVMGAWICTFALPLMMIATLNYRAYGWFGTVEFRNSAFVRAYGALQRIVPDAPLPYVPITKDARIKAYAVSPAFARLKGGLEGDEGLAWATATAFLTNKSPEEYEIAGGWFMWALRNAMFEEVKPRTAREAMAFWEQVADEINLACDSGQLAALSRRDSFAPRLRPGDVGKIVRGFPAYFDYFATFRGFDAHPRPSTGDASLLDLFYKLTRWHLAPSPEAPETLIAQQARSDQWRIDALQRIGKSYRQAERYIVYLAISGFILWSGESLLRRRISPWWIVAFAAFLGFSASVTINCIIDQLSFPNMSPGAFAQIYTFMILFVSLVVGGILHELFGRERDAARLSDIRRAGAVAEPSASTM